MAIIKTIASVGATGNMGSAIAKSLSKKGNYRLLLMSNDQYKLVDLKLQLEKNKTGPRYSPSPVQEKPHGRLI